jgi:hypothetical protein
VSDDVILRTIERYQSTFSADDGEGWLALFTDDAVLEDPVGSPPHQGRAAIAGFWDAVHARTEHGTVRMTQGPAVCGLEAAWAFELDVTVKGRPAVLVPVDLGPMDKGWFLQAQFEDGTTFVVQAPEAFTQEQVLELAESVTLNR